LKKPLSFVILTFMALIFLNAKEITTVPKIDAPANVTIVYSDSTVTIGWDALPNTSKYYIYNQSDPYGVFVLVDSTVTTAWNGNYTDNKKFFQISAKETPPPAGFVSIPAGTFQMGDSFWEGSTAERPVHSVTLSDFYMGKYEVTQAEWSQYMPAENWSSYGTGDTYPVYYVSWYSILKYCNLRSMNEGLTPCYKISSSTDPVDWGAVPTTDNATWNAAICNWSANGYRLPTEAEWEYAARGGVHHGDNFRYSGSYLETDLTNYAWYSANSWSSTHPVGTKLPNQLGLYDMSGNLWEWCWDWYGSTYYQTCYDQGTVSNPTGPTTGSRVLRGGSWGLDAYGCRVAFRYDLYPCHSFYTDGGFRLSRTP